MTKTMISVERVLDLIAIYGAHTHTWPEEERAAAVALLEARPDMFADAITDARLLDGALEREVIPDPSSALSAQIMAAAPSPKARKAGILTDLKAALFPKGVRWPAGAALASLAMGLVGGYAYASTDIAYDSADEALYAAFGYDAETAWTVEDVS